ncbi:MAG: PD40 domain-containing protein, partial [Chloroflexi bacterium]|nr:PD40 domain-containing protein [Chloroflexota bacterium]
MRNTIRIVLTCFLAFAGTVALSCGGGGDGGRSGGGLLLFGDQRGIIELNIDTGLDRVLTAATTTTTSLRDPAVSPDGTRIVFTATAGTRTPGGGREVNGDLWIADRDGGSAHLLASHVAPNTGIAAPQWMDDATVLAVSLSLAGAGTPSTYRSRIVRVDVSTGATVDFLPDAAAFGLSPDRSRLGFVTADERSLGTTSTLDPSAVASLVRDGDHVYIVSPRYSPDGLTIAFVAFDSATYPPKTTEEEPEASLWRITSAGENLTRLASFESDDRSSLAWSGDAKVLYVQS